MAEKEETALSQAKEAFEELQEKLRGATDNEVALKARVAELENALAGAGSDSAQQLEALGKDLAESSALRLEMQAQLAEMTEKEAKVRSQAKEAVGKLQEKVKAVMESEAASAARVAELESALQGSDLQSSKQIE